MRKTISVFALSSLFLFGSVLPAQAGGWLGIHPEQTKGVLVGDIIKESPADKVGLQRGDVILQLNGRELSGVPEFIQMIYAIAPGTEIVLSYLRNGQLQEIKTKLESTDGHLSSLPSLASDSDPAVSGDKSPLSFNRQPLVPKSPGKYNLIPQQAHTHDYQTRLKSALSLLDAYDRISEEKKIGPEAKKTSDEIHAMLNQAKTLFDQFRLDEGMAVMERAYTMTRVALVQLRSGETLYDPLNFATPEDEFAYDLNRNNLYKMLLDQVTQTKGTIPNCEAKTDEARSLRMKAEETALTGDFKSAIDQLEKSTGILVELLRVGGLDLP
ncbi:MAG: PDZ domain-containing protein [Magnetococcus sp. DMHC-6]